MTDCDFLRALGLTIIEVPDLEDTVVLVPEHRVALIRAGLNPQDQQWAAQWLVENAGDALIGN